MTSVLAAIVGWLTLRYAIPPTFSAILQLVAKELPSILPAATVSTIESEAAALVKRLILAALAARGVEWKTPTVMPDVPGFWTPDMLALSEACGLVGRTGDDNVVWFPLPQIQQTDPAGGGA